MRNTTQEHIRNQGVAIAEVRGALQALAAATFTTKEQLQARIKHFEEKLAPSESLNLMLRDWDMTANAGCELDNGEHLLVVDVPEYGLAGSWAFEYAGEGSGAACRAAAGDHSPSTSSTPAEIRSGMAHGW